MKYEDFSKKGFIIIKNAISHKVLKMLRYEILSSLGEKKNNSYHCFKDCTKNLKHEDFFKIINLVNKNLFYKNLIELTLNQKKLKNCLVNLLGSDLAVSSESSLTLNVPENKNNYYFKDWHQEIWSGASVSNVQIWLPIFQKNSKNGQLSFIKESHMWGHVPHSNRKPIDLPKKYSILNTRLSDGDVLIFSTTLMHRSQQTNNTRLGLAMTVKNFKHNDISYSNNFNWRIFSYSEITKIQRILGNHYLSPFRLLDVKKKIEFN